MYFKGKYIIVNDNPVIFPETLNHSDVKVALFGSNPCSGAGFVHVNHEGRYVCYGESISLRIKSNPEDSNIVNRYLGGMTDDI